MKNILSRTALAATLPLTMLLPTGANADLLTHNPAHKLSPGKLEGGIIYRASDTKSSIKITQGEGFYRETITDDLEIGRVALVISGAYGWNDMFDLYGGIALNTTSQVNDTYGTTGSGSEFGAGVRGVVLGSPQFTVYGYGQMSYIDDDYGTVSFFVEDEDGYEYPVEGKPASSGFEITAGAVASTRLNETMSVYAGLEITPFSSLDFKLHSDLPAGDLERDGILTIRLGGEYQVNETLFAYGGFSIMNSKSLSIGVGSYF